MDDVLLLVAHTLLHARPVDPQSLIAFVKLQATHRAVWKHYRHDHELWRALGASLPQWSLPPHMGLRRRVITGIKLLVGRCIACGGRANRVFMAYQARLCRGCCHRLLVSDFELAWGYGVERASPPYIVRYIGETRVLFFMRQHLPKLPESVVRLTRRQVRDYMRRWPGVNREHIRRLVDRMG